MNQVQKTARMSKVREGLTAADSGTPNAQNGGLNFAGYDNAVIQIVPSGGAIVDVEVKSWCEGSGSFIPVNPAATFSNIGASNPYQFTIPVNGLTIFVEVTSLTGGGTCDVWAGGHRIGDIG